MLVLALCAFYVVAEAETGIRQEANQRYCICIDGAIPLRLECACTR